MKRVLLVFLSLIILLTINTNIYAENEINVVLNGEKVIFDTEPILMKGRILVPIRKITEIMGYEVKWFSASNDILIENDKKRIVVELDDLTICYDDKVEMEDGEIIKLRKYYKLDVPAQIYNDRTYIPIRAIAEIFGAEVTYNDEINTVMIRYDDITAGYYEIINLGTTTVDGVERTSYEFKYVSDVQNTQNNGLNKPDIDVENYELQYNAYDANNISFKENKTIVFKEQKTTLNSDVIIWSGTMMLPIKQILQAIGYNAYYDPVGNIFCVHKDDWKIDLYINKNYCYKYKLTDNDQYEYDTSYTFKTPPIVYDNVLYVPFETLNMCCNSRINVTENKFIIDTTKVIEFEDKAIEGAVRTSLGDLLGTSYYSGLLTQDLIEQVTAIRILDNGALDGYYSLTNSKLNIKTLNDIEKLPNLDTFVLRAYGGEVDITPLTYKKNWKYIDLWETDVTDISVFDKITVEEYIAFPEYGMMFQLKNNELGNADCSYQEALSAYKSVFKAIDKALECISEDMSDYEKYKALHDYLVDNMCYDNNRNDLRIKIRNYFDSNYYDEKLSALSEKLYMGFDSEMYRGLVKEKGICSTYAFVYRELCQMCGLDCEIIDGVAGGELHAWNVVKINDIDYHIDVTWDDTGNGGCYKYFMLTEDELSAKGTHKISSDNI